MVALSARKVWFSAITALSLGACQGAPPADDGSSAPSSACAGAGTICTLAGNGDPAFTGEGELATTTSLYYPVDLEFAPDGRAYLLDWNNHRVRRLDADGRLRTVLGTDEIGDGPIAGTGDETVPPGVPGTDINLNHPTDIQFSPDGGTLILAAWHNHKVRQMDMGTSLVDVVCGRGPGFAGDGGPDAAALMNQPKSIVLAPSGDLFIVDTRNFRIRRIAAGTGIIDTVAGVGMRGSGGDGGDPLAAQFSFQVDGDNPEPGGAIAMDGSGRLYVADTENHRIRRIDFSLGLIETVVGDGTAGFGGDGGPALAAELSHPRDVELAPDGRLFIADTENHRVRVVDLATGTIDTVAGNGTAGFAGDGGQAREASLQRPFGIAFDAAGDLYVADTLNNRIRRVVAP
jgi:DNA-binding beta-propeller fold protein YncE